MSMANPKFNDMCELDGDYIGAYPGAGYPAAGGAISSCTAPEVPCPNTGGCMNPGMPKFNDICEPDGDSYYPHFGASTTGTTTTSTSTGATTTSTSTGTTTTSTSTGTTTTSTSTGTTSTTTGSTSTSTSTSGTTTGTDTTGSTSSTTTTTTTTPTTTTTTNGDSTPIATITGVTVHLIDHQGGATGTTGTTTGASASSCTAPEIPCPRTGGCMNPMHDNYEDICKFDGDYYPGQGLSQPQGTTCVSPQVYCPATGGCMSQYDPNWNDMCEMRILRKTQHNQEKTTKNTDYNKLVAVTLVGFMAGVAIFFIAERYFYRTSKHQDALDDVLLSAPQV